MANKSEADPNVVDLMAMHMNYDAEATSSRATSTLVVAKVPPIDGGVGAWTYLACGIALEALSWGFPLSWGVFQDFYSTRTDFGSTALLPVVGILGTAITYLLSPILIPYTTLHPRSRKLFMSAGLACCVCGCIGAAFATSVWHLILTQGFLYGLGVAGLYCPTIPMLFEWFDKRKGLATGIMFAGTGLSGVVLPFLFVYLLETRGPRLTMVIWTCIMIICLLPAVFFIHGRDVGESEKRELRPPSSKIFGLFSSCRIWLLTASNLFHSIAYMLPLIYIPSYGREFSLSSLQCTILASLLNLSSVIGQILLGQLSDVLDIYLLISLSASISSGSVFLLWGFANGFAALVAFTIIFGLAAGGVSSLWARFTSSAVPETKDSAVCFSIVYGTFAAQRGIGYIIGGPISSALMSSSLPTLEFAQVRGNYGGLIVFIGCALVASSVGGLGRFFRN